MKAIEEFIRRSGATLLWIKVRRPGLSEDIAEFLLRIMEKNWHRIQKLVVFKQCTNFNDNLFQLAYKSPAPYLETFHLAFAVYDDGVDTPGAPFTALFGGHAPMLRQFCLDGHFIHQREPWLHQLHSLVLTGEYHACDLLAILTATHSLQELEIESRDDDLILQSFPLVSLPRLRSLNFSGSPHRCAMLLDHVEIPPGCSLIILIYSPSEDLSIEETDEQHISVVNAFNRHARRLLQLTLFQVVYLYMDRWGDNSISMTGEASSCCYSIEIELDKKYTSTSNQVTIILNTLGQLDFSRTTSLNFWSSGPFNNPSFFDSFSSLDTICVDKNSLECLITLEEGVNSTEKPHILFPSLKTVDFAIISNFDLALQPTDQVEVAVKFVLSRIQNSYPIAVLDMVGFWSFNPAPNLDALSEAQGLKVLYKLEGMTGIFEYICGSSEPARQK